MRELSPVRLTERGTLLLLVDSAGTEFVVATDARLRDTLGRALEDRSRQDVATDVADALPIGLADAPGVAGVSVRAGGAAGAPGAVGPSGPARPPRPLPTPAQKAVEMNLRPREIQDRIRAGESVADLATVAGAPEAKVMAFAGPVLAERAHVADTALGVSLRRVSDEGSSAPEAARTLGAAALDRLRAEGADREALTWDAWRREDGRWTIEARYRVDGEQQRARFTFDVRGRFVTADDVEARWLVGDGSFPTRAEKDRARSLRLAPPPAPARDHQPADQPYDQERLDEDFGAAVSPFGSLDGRIGEDVITMLGFRSERSDEPRPAPLAPAPIPTRASSDEPSDEPTHRRPADISETAAAVRGARIPQQVSRASSEHDDLAADPADETSAAESPEQSAVVGPEDPFGPAAGDPSAQATDAAAAAEVEAPAAAGDESLSVEVVGSAEDWVVEREDTAALARRHPRKQRGRASVPTWDEIMFGGGAD